MEYSLASYAIPPEDAESFQLQHYAKHTLQYQMVYAGATGGDIGADDRGEEEEAVFVNDDGSQIGERSVCHLYVI